MAAVGGGGLGSGKACRRRGAQSLVAYRERLKCEMRASNLENLAMEFVPLLTDPVERPQGLGSSPALQSLCIPF